MASRHIVRPDGGCVNLRPSRPAGAWPSPPLLAVAPSRTARAASSGGRVLDRRPPISRSGCPTSPPTTSRGAPSSPTGLGLAAAYLEEHLREWGVKPAGDNGSYLQTVRVARRQGASHSTVTVDVGGERRTFADGEAIRFQRNTGGRQTVTLDRVEFAGYGLDVPRAGHEDYRGRDVSGAAVVWLGAEGRAGPPRPAVRSRRESPAAQRPRPLRDRGTARGGQHRAWRQPAVRGAAGRTRPAPRRRRAAAAVRFRRPTSPRPNGSTGIVPPQVTGTDAFFEFLFSRAPVKYSELKRRAEAREAAAGVSSGRRHAHLRRRHGLRSRPHPARRRTSWRSSRARTRS